MPACFRKKQLYCYLFMGISLLLFGISMLTNRDYYAEIALGSVYWYQLRQILSILLLYLFGYLFMKGIQHRLSDLWCHIMAFPSAVCLWCFMSQFLLLADFTYRIWRVLFLMTAFIALCYLIRRIRKVPTAFCVRTLLPSLAVVTGIACLCSTGYCYIVLNYDSYFYFSDYGKALMTLMSYKDIVSKNSFVMTNIGQFLPLVSAYTTRWGLDTMIPLQCFMLINTLTAYAVCIYQAAVKAFRAKKAGIYTAGFVILLLSCTPFFLFSNWILSNTWIAFYLFLLFWLNLTYDPAHPGVDYALLFCGFSVAVTMLRKDGIIFICFLFVCCSYRLYRRLSDASQKSRRLHSAGLALIFLPSGLYQLFYLYYLTHIIHATTTLSVGTSLLDGRLRLLLTLGILATMAYLFLLHGFIERLLKHRLPYIFTAGLFGVFALFVLKERALLLDFIDVWFRNLFGTAFGFALFGILLLVCLILLCRPVYDDSLFFVVGYLLVMLIIYWNKGNLEQNIDNSGLRALYQILMTFYAAAAIKIIPFFAPQASGSPSDKEDTRTK